MRLIKDLPKYKKSWGKEYSLSPIQHEEGGIYLSHKYSNPLMHRGEVKQIYLSQFDNDNLYFFEVFKYLKKYQMWTLITRRTTSHKEVKAAITSHLLKKYIKTIRDERNKLGCLNDYSHFLSYCFEEFTKYRSAEISLVIQKKIGYKYYENIIYT